MKHLIKHPDISLKRLYTTIDLQRLFQVLTTQFYNIIADSKKHKGQETKKTESQPWLNQINLESLFT